MSDHKRTKRTLLITTLVTAAFLAALPLRALPRQTPGTSAASGVTVLRFGKLWDGSKVTTDAVVVARVTG